MSFDGLITRTIVNEMNKNIIGGKIEKIYQPEADELVFSIHSKVGSFKLYASCASSHARVHFINEVPVNPAIPLSFCMLLRKHLQGGRISEITQKDSERIIEFSFETYNELGFSVNKKLIIEIMGKHSNIILVDAESMKIIDSIKRVSIDVNRVRQILPGKIYEYPPSQGKLALNQVTPEALEKIVSNHAETLSQTLLDALQGISPPVAATMGEKALTKVEDQSRLPLALYEEIRHILEMVESHQPDPVVYMKEPGTPLDFHVIPLINFEDSFETIHFKTLSEALEFYYANKSSSNKIKQKSIDLEKAIKNNLNKLYLKKQRLSEDLMNAEGSDGYRLFGELLTANLHLVKAGESLVTVTNYYDGSQVSIPLDKRLSPSKNAQLYYKKYGKAKTAVKEKTLQLEELAQDITYVESVAAFLEGAETLDEIESIRTELIASGYLRKRKSTSKPSKLKIGPYSYVTAEGFKVLAGRNNIDNDILTFKTASPKDLWFHAKDIPGSHVILFLDGKSPSEAAILEAASIAALHSKAKDSENVPIDYTKVRYVKKPKGSKPGMVIFTDNRTVYINPYKEKEKV